VTGARQSGRTDGGACGPPPQLAIRNPPITSAAAAFDLIVR